MIKFRCPYCGQKIGVNDEGTGIAIACPSCVASITVPVGTAPEFCGQATGAISAPVAPVELVGSVKTTEPVRRNETLVAPQRDRRTTALLREELRPHLARMMMDKFVRALFSQRAHLLETQQASTEHVAEMEQRLIKIQELLQARLNTYAKRVEQLERMLVQAQQENRELTRTKFQLAQKVVELETQQRTRVDLRDAGFLLRA